MGKSKDVQSYIGFKIAHKTKIKLKKQADKEGRTVSNLLVQIIKQYLKG